MAKKIPEFICVTQTASIASIPGPSGEKYVSQIGRPFQVYREQDVPHFQSNPRFLTPSEYKKGVKKGEVATPQTLPQQFEAWLVNAGLSESARQALFDRYETLDMLKGHVKKDDTLTDLIGKDDMKLLVKALKAEAKGD